MDAATRLARDLGALLDGSASSDDPTGHGPAPTDEPRRPLVDGLVQAAVLVPIYLSAGEPHVVLTRRRSELRRHAGEISFPGGRRDPEDASLLHTALREAEEEIGLPAAEVSPAGALAPTSTFVTGYAIHPFVGAIDPDCRFTLSPQEVQEVLQLPLRRLARARALTKMTRRGITFDTDAYILDGHTIWGATARILQDLLERLAPLL